jgi:vacuolar-type H+-ATPase subunit H
MAAEQRATELERARSNGTPAAASEAPDRAPSTVDDDTETIRRTLILAQRTADAAIKEAEEEATRTLQSAQEQVQRLYADAEDQARRLVIDAESEARKKSDDTRQRLVKEIIALEETRDALRADQGILERHLDEQRLRLRSSIGELQRLLDDPGRLRVANAPEISGATMPELVDPPLLDDEDDDDSEPLPAALAGSDRDESEHDAIEANVQTDDDAIIDLGASPAPFDVEANESHPLGGVTYSPPDESVGDAELTGLVAGNAISVAGSTPEEEDAWVRFMQTDLDGPPTREVAAVEGDDEDAYLSELRKAMLADTSAGSIDSDEQRARPRFGRRR